MKIAPQILLLSKEALYIKECDTLIFSISYQHILLVIKPLRKSRVIIPYPKLVLSISESMGTDLKILRKSKKKTSKYKIITIISFFFFFKNLVRSYFVLVPFCFQCFRSCITVQTYLLLVFFNNVIRNKKLIKLSRLCLK